MSAWDHLSPGDRLVYITEKVTTITETTAAFAVSEEDTDHLADKGEIVDG